MNMMRTMSSKQSRVRLSNSMNYVEDLHSRLVELGDGFEQYGSVESPFTLRGRSDSQAAAEEIHAERESEKRQEDEATNEAIQRDVEIWSADLWAYDFPFVDTIPTDELLRRAQSAADEGLQRGFINSLDVDANIPTDGEKGHFRPGSKTVNIDTDGDEVLGYRKGPTLAHEVGHAFHIGVMQLNQRPGYERDVERVFETETQQEEAITLSERLRGSFSNAPSDYRDYRLGEEELFADVFALLMIEPSAARRIGPEAVGRVEGIIGELLPETV